MSESIIPKKKGVLVLFTIITIVVFFILISVLVNNSQFENDRINGTYSGTITIPGQTGMQLNLTFDGEAYINGSLYIDGVNYDFDQMEYICLGSSVNFSIYVFTEDLNWDFVFVSEISETASLLSGSVRYYTDIDTYSAGTFFCGLIE